MTVTSKQSHLVLLIFTIKLVCVSLLYNLKNCSIDSSCLINSRQLVKSVKSDRRHVQYDNVKQKMNRTDLASQQSHSALTPTKDCDCTHSLACLLDSLASRLPGSLTVLLSQQVASIKSIIGIKKMYEDKKLSDRCKSCVICFNNIYEFMIHDDTQNCWVLCSNLSIFCKIDRLI